MKTICGFSAFISGLYSPYWKRMGILISENTTENIWQSKRCVLGGDICEKFWDGNIYAASGCSENVLDEYIKTSVVPEGKTGAIWDGKENRLLVFSGSDNEFFYANPPGRFVFSNKKEGLFSFPGVYKSSNKCTIHRLSPGNLIVYDKTGICQLSHTHT